MIFFSGNEERTLIFTADMHFLIVSNFYAVYLRLKNPSLEYFIA